jgi:hypothetical protein
MGAFSRRSGIFELVLVCAAALSCGGCTLDERTLHAGNDDTMQGAGGDGSILLGQGNTGGAGATEDGTGATGDGTGAMGAAGAGSGNMPPSTTRWTFDTDVDGWEPDPDVDQQWSSTDVANDPNSGSLLVSNISTGATTEFSTAGTSRCVRVVSGKSYDVSVQIYIAPGQSAGGGGFSVQFFDDTECQGTLVDLTNFLTATTGAWQLGERPTAPIGAKSALIDLVASKVLRDPKFTVLFDDVKLDPM